MKAQRLEMLKSFFIVITVLKLYSFVDSFTQKYYEGYSEATETSQEELFYYLLA